MLHIHSSANSVIVPVCPEHFIKLFDSDLFDDETVYVEQAALASHVGPSYQVQQRTRNDIDADCKQQPTLICASWIPQSSLTNLLRNLRNQSKCATALLDYLLWTAFISFDSLCWPGIKISSHQFHYAGSFIVTLIIHSDAANCNTMMRTDSVEAGYLPGHIMADVAAGCSKKARALSYFVLQVVLCPDSSWRF